VWLAGKVALITGGRRGGRGDRRGGRRRPLRAPGCNQNWWRCHMAVTAF